MARGCVRKRCRVCRNAGVEGTAKCNHREAEYHIIYHVDGKQKSEKVGPNKKEAEKLLAHRIYEINNGLYCKPTGTTFKDYANSWLDEKYAKNIIKPSTYSRNKSSLKCHLIPFFGDSLLSKISQYKVEAFVSSLLSSHSPKTIRNLLTLLHTIFKSAKKRKLIRDNPIEDIERPKVEYEEMDFLEPHEIKKFLNCAEEPCKMIVLMAVLTGMRRGEIFGLQWGDIENTSNTIYVRRSLFWPHGDKRKDGEGWTFVSPKSKRSIRSIVMTPMLKKALEIHRITAPVSPLDLVFCNALGNPMDADNFIHRDFEPTFTRAELRKVRFHSLRHSYVSLLIAQGENIKFIQSQVGHASIQTTLDRYGHIMPNAQHGVGDRLDGQVFNTELEKSLVNSRSMEHPHIDQNKSKQQQEQSMLTVSNI